ncbi:MAG: LysR family transcriptional regulator [Deltaproteobacteria bacterium]|nr:LysR family transcriptional regulator [Deltaproteobacteria bacterium]
MHIPWSDVELLVAIADRGSLSKAAAALAITQPTVSRRLAALEASLGEPLFVRGVEGTTLTALGERVLEPARRMAECASEVVRTAAAAEVRPRGVVRLTAPPGVAFDFVAPMASELRRALPEVELEVVSTIDYIDLTRRDADLALRVQPLSRPDARRALVAVASVEHGVGVFASEAYAKALPRGYGLADLTWIAWPASHAHLPPNPQLAARIPGFRPAFASDDFLVQLLAAEAGAGAIILGKLRSPRALPTPLVELAIDLGPLRSTLHLVGSRAALAIPRVRAVADLLAAELEVAAKASKASVRPRRAQR